jgi:hypothetical protein
MTCSAVRAPVTKLSAWFLIISMIFKELPPGNEAQSVRIGDCWMVIWLGFFA